MNHSICVQFAFKYAEHKLQGNDITESFIKAGNDFKREIKATRVHKGKEGEIRAYLFSDDSSATYDVNGDFFKFK